MEGGKATLRFAIEEMKSRGLGLAFNDEVIPEYPNMRINKKLTAGKIGFNKVVDFVTGKYVRPITNVSDVHFSAIERYQENGEWRPNSLDPLETSLLDTDLNHLIDNP